MILLNEVAKAGPYMIVYRDSEDPRLFYYMPRFAELARRDATDPNSRYIFGHQIFRRDPNDPSDGVSVYNMTVRGVMPGSEYQRTKDELEAMVGHWVSIVAVPGFDLKAEALTDLSFVQTGGRVQTSGGNLFTDLAISMTFQEWCEPDMASLFMSEAAWTGQIGYKLTGLLTPFKARIRANWKRVQDHFRAQASVRWWFVSSNVSHEVQKLMENGTISVTIEGGTPEQKEQVYALAKQIAARLFVSSVQIAPLPSHPNAGVVSLSLNHSRVEQDKSEEWVFEERDIETRALGMAIVVGRLDRSYFPSLEHGPTVIRGPEPLGAAIDAHAASLLAV